MEPKSEESSSKEEGELSDDNEDVESSELKVIDEWIAEPQSNAESASSKPKNSPAILKSHSDFKSDSKDYRTPRDNRRARERDRHDYRSSRSIRGDRDRYERRYSPSNSPVNRRPESRFWDRHRATTPRIQNAHSRRSAGRPHATNDKENSSSLMRDVRENSPNDTNRSAIPSLLDLATAPPPPPPPPLPEIPPPERQESPPPPPPPLFAPRRKRNRNKLSAADKRARARERLQQISQAPITDDPEDVDYIDLLLEYKEIQKQLDSIKKEEEKTASILADINSAGVKTLDDRTNVLVEEDDDLIIVEDPPPEVITVDDDEPRAMVEAGGTAKESSSQEHVEDNKPEDDEEDLDELQLRFLALASAANANKRAQLDTGELLVEGNQGITSGDDQRKTEITSKKEQVATATATKSANPSRISPRERRENRKRSHGPTRRESQEAKRRRSVGTRSRERDNRRASLERERRLSSRDRARKEDKDKKDRLRRNDHVKWRKEAQKILVLDDHREQAERFLQLIGEQSRPNVLDSLQDKVSSKEPVHLQEVSPLKEINDNYDSVEMDIDSNPGSPNIELEIERLQQSEDLADEPLAPPGVSLSENFNPYSMTKAGIFFGSRDSSIPGLGDLIPGLGGELPAESPEKVKSKVEPKTLLSGTENIPLPPNLPPPPPPPPMVPVAPPQPVPPPPAADAVPIKPLLQVDTTKRGEVKQAMVPQARDVPLLSSICDIASNKISHVTPSAQETPLSQRLMQLADYDMQKGAEDMEQKVDVQSEKRLSTWEKDLSSPQSRWTKNPGLVLFSSKGIKDNSSRLAGGLHPGNQVIPGLDVHESEDEIYDPETPSVSPPPVVQEQAQSLQQDMSTDTSDESEHEEDDIAMTALRAQLILGMKQRQERKIQQLDEITGSPMSDIQEPSNTDNFEVQNEVPLQTSDEQEELLVKPMNDKTIDAKSVFESPTNSSKLSSPALKTSTRQSVAVLKNKLPPSVLAGTVPDKGRKVTKKSASISLSPAPKPVPLLTSVLTSTVSPAKIEVPSLKRQGSTSSLSSIGETTESKRTVVEIPDTKRTRPMLKLPQHKPVIIPLGDDSEESDSESPTKAGGVAGSAASAFLGNLDQFLSNVRHDVEKQETVGTSTRTVTTPEAVKNLSQNQRLEYKKLKEMLMERGDSDKGDKLLNYSLSDSPASSVTSSPKRVVVAKSMEQVTMEKRLKLIEVALDKHRSTLGKEERTLATERLLASRKKAILHAAKSKAQTLKEQLEAAQRIVSVTEKRIETHNQQMKNIQDRVNKEKVWVIKFEEERIKTGKKLFGDGFPDNSNNTKPASEEFVISPVRPPRTLDKQKTPGSRQVVAKPGTLMTVTIAAKKNMTKISKEKQYWQQLANEYEKKIELLKQAKASVQARKGPKPVGKAPAAVSFGQTSSKKRKSPIGRLPIPEKIKTEEKIQFDFGSDVENEIVKITPRRKSLLDMSPGITTPKLGHPSTPTHRRRSSEENATLPVTRGIERPPADKLNRLKIKLHQMLLQGLKVRNDATSSTSDNELGIRFGNSGGKIDDLTFTPRTAVRSKQNGILRPSALSYTSPLLTFKSYRFCPYFRTKSHKSITSASFSHRINTDTVWCRFDLTGDCQDKNCPWQHMSDVKMSEEQLLADIISYATGITGVAPSDNNSATTLKKINSFVKEFRVQNAMLNFEEQCILLANKVSENAKHKAPHLMFTEKRRHQIRPKKNPKQSFEDPMTDIQMEYSYKTDSRSRLLPTPDDVIQETDVRYWMLGTEESHDLESLLANDPNNTQLWMKLAYKKLSSNSPGDSNIDQALNILSRGLEQNKESSDMWLYFLELFARRGDPDSLLELYEQAVTYAPVYQLWWKYQNSLVPPLERFAICQRARDWLCSLSDLSEKRLSHYLLQIVLLQTKLKLQSSTSAEAFTFLEKILLADSSNLLRKLYDVSDKLTAEDTTVAWMCLVHVKAFKCLPPHLYDPSGENCDIVVNKDLGVYNWIKPTGTFTQAERQELNNLLQKARSVCTEKEDGRIQQSVQLYINTCPEMGTTNSYEGCVEGTNIDKSCIKLWLYVARYVDILGNNEIGVNRMFEKAIELNPTCVELYHTAALNYLLKGNKEVAVEFLEHATQSFFQLTDKQLTYPSLLYCKLLNLEVPLGFESPLRKEGITNDTVQNQQLHLWLSFCLLLELRGDLKRAVDMFERALCLFGSKDDLSGVWLSYLKFTARQSMSRKDESCAFVLFELVNRCLLTTPCKFPLPYHSGNQHWLDYSFHNTVLEMVLNWLSENEALPTLQYYSVEMPSNISLLIRTCDMARSRDMALAKGLLKAALLDFPRCITLWKM